MVFVIKMTLFFVCFIQRKTTGTIMGCGITGVNCLLGLRLMKLIYFIRIFWILDRDYLNVLVFIDFYNSCMLYHW